MTSTPNIRQPSEPPATEKILLGEDWFSPEGLTDRALNEKRIKRGIMTLHGSPLARKIIVFNMLALVILVAGVLFATQFRDGLVVNHEKSLVLQTRLISEALGRSGTAPTSTALAGVTPDYGVEMFLYDAAGKLVVQKMGTEKIPGVPEPQTRSTAITDLLNGVWNLTFGFLGRGEDAEPPSSANMAKLVNDEARARNGLATSAAVHSQFSIFAAGMPVFGPNGKAIGTLVLTSPAGEIQALVRAEREQILQMFVIALLVSVGLSLVLASTIANPLSDLAAAAELGRDRDKTKLGTGRIRIPDLTARPDEIGRLSAAMRGMVAALYDRVESNEQFAADVAHEIKNPLASLRSAVGSMRIVKTDEHREKLLKVIEHDVRRLDRLVSDISNASRLDSELVKEQELEFNLVKMVGNLCDYHGREARERGVEFLNDFAESKIMIAGLEARLAQVFVNLITNAISFCEKGDAIRVWIRRRENRVLVVIEDTGPGIPEGALEKVFKRFYSDRPANHFGNNSGLGLSISKQIVEAHGGVIWAENIRPTNADPNSAPLGARFVVGLPV